MKSIAKKLSLLLVLAIGIIACFTLFSCGESTPQEKDPPKDTEYTVYVENSDGTAATGILVQICVILDGHENDPAPASPDDLDERLGECKVPAAVNENGKYGFANDGKTYAIHLYKGTSVANMTAIHNFTVDGTSCFVTNIGPSNKVVTIKLAAE